MLCDECQQREATVFLTTILNGELSKKQLCGVCGGPTVRSAGKSMTQSIGRLRSFDARFSNEAYNFVLLVIHSEFAASVPASGHLTAAAIAEAFRRHALKEFGLRALPTLAGWGVHSCDDLGAIVFQLVRLGLLGSLPEERAEDFSGLYDFATAFPTTA